MAGGVFLCAIEQTLLVFENMEHQRMIRIRINPPEPFYISYVHSIYGKPAAEEFEARRHEIVLQGVITQSPGVMEYYGFEEAEGFRPLTRVLGASFIVRRGMVPGQRFAVRDRMIPFGELAEEGDRIRVSVSSISLGSYLFTVLFGK